MNEIMEIAQTYCKITKSNILRLDIQFNKIEKIYVGYLKLSCDIEFEIREDGNVLRKDWKKA